MDKYIYAHFNDYIHWENGEEENIKHKAVKKIKIKFIFESLSW